jgi:hypothetical protein
MTKYAKCLCFSIAGSFDSIRNRFSSICGLSQISEFQGFRFRLLKQLEAKRDSENVQSAKTRVQDLVNTLGSFKQLFTLSINISCSFRIKGRIKTCL